MFSWDESQATLVNPQPTYELELTKTSVLNNVLRLDGQPRFLISTVDAAAAITKITDLSTNQLLVTIRRRALLPDDIKFTYHYDGEAVKMKEWLREEQSEDGHTQWMIDTPMGSYIWRIQVTLRLSLCPINDIDNPIAWVKHETPTSPITALVLKRGTESFMDEILAGFLILELKLRMKEKEMTKAFGWNANKRYVLGTMYADTGNFNRRQ
ncbi:hypothetical protein BDN70DRAFT_880213 [Pholiota conissans]|uniref:DUF6593 domain-containing protein n=1 Tax=Pholiota conissans TaxID=109636 RepID=A0A9P6D028_9AGAR|nr:hypothetical protein BDN70DRAFT_880213 [Pholiota conissans]